MIDYSEYTISFVVDNLPMHYYQAELLLFSLQHNANVPKENIVVHCLDRVDTLFLDFLKKNQYRYKIIPPFLDGKYCNKLQQLESFENIKTKGVLLLDTDVFLLKPLRFMDDNHVFGKIVDGPNPPVQFIKEIFEEAGISFPKTIATDFNIRGGKTLDCYFNGGLYFIPKKYVTQLSKEWRKWATWIYERREKYSTIHIDQISMAMALSSIAIPYKQLSTNYNMPIHRAHEPHYFQKEKDIFLLHYHQEINQFGLINDGNILNQNIVKAVERANQSISELSQSIFYEGYRKSLIIPSPEKPDNFEVIEEKLQILCNRFSKKIRLVLHAGTPKTGTTSLQFYLDEQREELLKHNILYATKDNSSFAPKHQWVASTLRNNNFLTFLDRFDRAIEAYSVKNIDTIILSTEGIYNHWWDYSSEAKYFLMQLGHYFDLELWVWFRDPVSFAESLYRQYLKNPRLQRIQCYGRDLSLDEIMKDEWFRAHLDYVGFLLETEMLFGKDNIHAFEMKGDVVETVCQVLNVQIDNTNVSRKNEKLGCTLIEVLRIFNRFEISHKEKDRLVDKLYEIEREFSHLFDNKKICNGNISKITRLSNMQKYFLHRQYNLSFEN